MRAMTVISAFVLRVIIPISVDLPTPEPAKMPSRCPWPQVSRPSRTRMPSGSGSVIRRRLSGSGGEALTGYICSAETGPRSSSGRPNPSSTRPSMAGPTPNCSGPPVAVTSLLTRICSVSPSGMSSSRLWRKPTTSAGIGGMQRSAWMWHSSPIRAGGPSDSTIRPILWRTRPMRRTGSSVSRRPRRSCSA